MTLIEYLRLPHRWRWGFCDCMIFPGDWVAVARPGHDPVDELRGSYQDPEGANAMIMKAGGAEALVGSRLGPLGFPLTREPIDGDIGIVRVATGFDADSAVIKEVPAIRFGPLWAVMSARGPMVKKLDFTGTAWRIL